MTELDNAGQLFQWAQRRLLSTQQLADAAKISPLAPGNQQWLAYAGPVLLSGAVLLLCSALIFFFAHNWPQLHHLTKIALALLAVTSCAGLAYFTAPTTLAHRAALLACSLCTGALLALIGQTYQTGADIWQLFASWAALITPLVLLSKSRGCYLLWFILLDVALWRYLNTSRMLWWSEDEMSLQILALGNTLMLLFAEFVLPKLGLLSRQWLVWFSAVCVLVLLTFGAVIGVWESSYRIMLAYYIIAALAIGLWYLWQRRDLLLVTLSLFSGIAVSTALLSKLLEHSDSLVLANVIAIYVIGSSAAVALLIKRLRQESPNVF